MRRERGLGLVQLIVGLAVVAFVGLMAAKLLPAYIEYWSVKKIFAAMEQTGETKQSVREIRRSFERRGVIDDVRSIKPEDIEVTKEAGETILTATWQANVHMVGNLSACLDFVATTAK